jgi:hypothetical protein
MNPHTVSLASDVSARGENQPTQSRFLGFDPHESPWQPNTCLARPLLDAPLGFALPGYSSEDLAGIPPEAPLTCLADYRDALSTSRTSEYHSASTWPRQPDAKATC